MVREERREKGQEKQIRGCIRNQDSDPTKAQMRAERQQKGCIFLKTAAYSFKGLRCVAACCSMLQFVAASVMQNDDSRRDANSSKRQHVPSKGLHIAPCELQPTSFSHK